ncbi:MAG TPA: multifunctional CCA tRNA nucleotidyl transferase/2'3'-cyclic phosphodiesterase/2'nucleotidase/phosphatase [Casimicrobiaceae bacterium]
MRIFRVGGSVRDELLGRPHVDHDFVVVGATPEIMLASGFVPVGKDFPVFLHPTTRDEYALARTERKHGRGYRGFQFFATPDVTLEEDLRRRDLTINAMARAENGELIDPHGGLADLRDGVLRHVSEAFAEDPLRVLRAARFAARFGFRIADETLALMRTLVAAGELETLAPERVWQEIGRGLCEAHPSRMLAALRTCGALAALLPEVEALYALAVPDASPEASIASAGALVERALDVASRHDAPLPARYATLAQELDRMPGARAFDARIGVRRADALSSRLRAPVDCRDAARLAVRWHHALVGVSALTPARLLDVLVAADALRRPERFDVLLDAASAHVAALQGADSHAETRRRRWHAALATVREVDAAAIARDTLARIAGKAVNSGDAIAAALRRERIAALRRQMR